MNLRDAAQQALKALKIAQDDCIHGEMAEPSPIFEKAITALRAALAEPQPEPVAWVSKHALDRIKDFDGTIYANGGFDDAAPLYTAPPQRQPLTDEEIVDLCAAWDATPGTSMADLVRMTEKAHGIGGDK